VLLLGSVGFVVNLVGVRLLHSGARSSLNVRGAYLEVLSDLLASIGVILSALLQMRFGWVRADPIVSLGIAAFIVPRIWLLMREATDVLMEAAPRHLDVVQVRQLILEEPGVLDIHDLHIWTITSGRVCLSAHVVTEEGSDRDGIIVGINQRLREAFGLDHTTLQVEGQGEDRFPGQRSERSCNTC
jgi:cobalt-zinc-cadmium efflux system protein